MSTCEDISLSLPDRLAVLLQRQITLARKSDFRGLERLTDHTDQIVRELTNAEAGQQMTEGKRKHLTALYRELALVLAGAKDKVDRQVRQLGRVRKTLDAYPLHR